MITLTDLSFNQFQIEYKLIVGLAHEDQHTRLTTATGEQILVMESVGAILREIMKARDHREQT